MWHPIPRPYFSANGADTPKTSGCTLQVQFFESKCLQYLGQHFAQFGMHSISFHHPCENFGNSVPMVILYPISVILSQQVHVFLLSLLVGGVMGNYNGFALKMQKTQKDNFQKTKNIQTTRYKQSLEERTLEFSKKVISFCKTLPNDRVNSNLINQIIRSATSVGANYCEANDSLGKKDLIHRLRISRKEAKETSYWLELIKYSNPNIEADELISETKELRSILSSIIMKLTG